MHAIVCSTSQTASNSSKLEIKLIQFARYLKRNELKLQDSMYHTTMKQVINRYQIIHLINPPYSGENYNSNQRILLSNPSTYECMYV
jgi:hypothetical protein